MAEFYKQLLKAMDIKGITQSELCNKTKIPKSAMSQYMSGKFKPKQTRTYLIAKALNVNEAWLMGFENVPMERGTQEPTTPKADNIIPLPKTKLVPLVGTIACGEPILADENIEDYVPMPTDTKGTFALRCKGDSMINARIFDGDIVFVREQPDVENGEIAAVLIGNDATLKKVYKYDNRLELRPENPTYKVMNYEGPELEKIRILGKAISFYSNIK